MSQIADRSPAVELMTTYMEAARAGDWDTAFGLFAEDVRFHIPGRGPLAGTRQGRGAARHYIETAIALAHDEAGGGVEVELIDMLASDERVCLLVNEKFHRASGTVEIRRANTYRVMDGEIVEIWIFEANQYEMDALFWA